MRPSEKFEAKAAGQKCSPEVVFSTLRTFFRRQRRHRASLRDRAGYLDRLLMSIVLSFSQNTVQQFTCPYRKFGPSRRAALGAAGFISDAAFYS